MIDFPFIVGAFASFLFSALVKRGQFLPISAGTGKDLVLSLSLQFHFFMALGTPGIGLYGKPLTITTLPILANQHFSAFALDLQEKFTALRALGPGHIVMAIGLAAPGHFRDKLGGIAFDPLDETLPVFPPLDRKSVV